MTSQLDFEKLLKSAGDTGLYQVTMFALVGVILFVAVDSIAINFLAGKMNHWCRVPGLESFDFSHQLNTGIPHEEGSHHLQYSHCYQYPVDYTKYNVDEIAQWNSSMMTENFTKNDWRSCDSWVFDKSIFVSTVVSEWNLVCDRVWLIDLISTIFMGGRVIACLVCGPISDRFGRKPTVLIFHVLKMIGCVMSLYSSSYVMYVVSRFFIAIGFTGSTLAVFVILTEVTGEKWRHIFGIGWTMLLTIGGLMLPAIAYFVRDFYYLQSIFTWPQFLLFFYLFLLDESPRWLISQGRTKDALKVLRKIAAVNRRILPENVELETLHDQVTKNGRPKQGSLIDMLSTPTLRLRSFVLWLNWFTASLIFYALMLNTGFLPGDIFLNTFLLIVVEIPANLIAIWLLGRVGRKITLSSTTILAGLSSLLMIPFMFFSGMNVVITCLAIVGKGFISVAYAAVYVVTAETYPTGIRNVGVGVSSSFGKLGAMAASFTGGYLSNLWRPFPCIIFGVLGTVSGSLVFLLPETMNEKLPETILDIENIGKISEPKNDETQSGSVEASSQMDKKLTEVDNESNIEFITSLTAELRDKPV